MAEDTMRLKAEVGDFIRVFEDNLSKHHSYAQAYQITEETHEKLTGRRRYSDIETFRVVRSRRFKNEKESKLNEQLNINRHGRQ